MSSGKRFGAYRHNISLERKCRHNTKLLKWLRVLGQGKLSLRQCWKFVHSFVCPILVLCQLMCTQPPKIGIHKYCQFQLCIIYLLRVSERGVAVVSDELHSLSRSTVEQWRLPVHHLYHHDTQRPDVHLVRGYVCIMC